MSSPSPEAIDAFCEIIAVCERTHLGVQITRVVDGWEVWCAVQEGADLVAEASTIDEALRDAAEGFREASSATTPFPRR